MSDLCKQTSVSPCASSPAWGPAHVGLSGLAQGVDVTTGRLRQKVPQSDSSEVVVCSSWGRSGKDAAGCSSHLQAGPVMAQTSQAAAARPPAPLFSQAPTGLDTIGLAHGPLATGLDRGPCCSVFPFSYWQLYWKVMGSCCAGPTAHRLPFCTCGVSWCDPRGPGALRKPVSGDLRVAFYGFLSSPCWVVLGPHLLLTQISPLLFAAHLREEGAPHWEKPAQEGASLCCSPSLSPLRAAFTLVHCLLARTCWDRVPQGCPRSLIGGRTPLPHGDHRLCALF